MTTRRKKQQEKPVGQLRRLSDQKGYRSSVGQLVFEAGGFLGAAAPARPCFSRFGA
jgi:hypothetical protein